MSAARQPRPRSRDRILDAAAELVREIGSGKLTLEGVAERAGLSKGGLLYNFPSKDALLEGMIERMIARFETEREALRPALAGRRNLEARLGAAVSLRTRMGEETEIANGLLAALSENPALLAPARRAMAEGWRRLAESSEDPDSAAIAWLAVEGLCNLEMHGLSPLSADDRARALAAIERLLDRGIAGDARPPGPRGDGPSESGRS